MFLEKKIVFLEKKRSYKKILFAEEKKKIISPK